jgi:hypothetical protein
VEVEDGSDDAELAADRVEVDVTQRLGEDGPDRSQPTT